MSDDSTKTKPESIPLRAPDGEVLAYACGLCRRAGTPMYSMGPPDADERAEAAESSKDDADACCTCRTCGKVETGIRMECEACRAVRDAEWRAKQPEILAKVAAEDAEADATFERSPDPAAARDLRDHMSDISEECYCAEWLIGCEFSLWFFMTEGPGEWGQSKVGADDLRILRLLSERSGGWVVWREDIGNVFVPLAEWLPMFKAEKERSAAWLAAYEANQAARAAEGESAP